MKKLRQFTLVQLNPVAKNTMADGGIKPPYIDDLPLIFLGEIKNMPTHGVFLGHRSGKIYSGYHMADFEEVPDEEV